MNYLVLLFVIAISTIAIVNGEDDEFIYVTVPKSYEGQYQMAKDFCLKGIQKNNREKGTNYNLMHPTDIKVYSEDNVVKSTETFCYVTSDCTPDQAIYHKRECLIYIMYVSSKTINDDDEILTIGSIRDVMKELNR